MNPIYKEYYVNGNSAHFIKKLWILDTPEHHPPVLNKGVPPNGCFTLAVIEGSGLRTTLKNQIQTLPEGIYFCGQITETIYFDIDPGTKATMIQLFPWTPVHFGMTDAHWFTDYICPADEIPQLTVLNVNDLIGLSSENLCRHITQIFNPLFRTNVNTGLITESTRMIIAKKGNIKVSSLASQLNCSVRHLQKLYRNFIGVSPKLFSTIIKLRDALDDVTDSDASTETLAQLAVANGYYDQPHFNTTFLSLIRTTPKNFNKEDFLLTIKK